MEYAKKYNYFLKKRKQNINTINTNISLILTITTKQMNLN